MRIARWSILAVGMVLAAMGVAGCQPDHTVVTSGTGGVPQFASSDGDTSYCARDVIVSIRHGQGDHDYQWRQAVTPTGACQTHLPIRYGAPLHGTPAPGITSVAPRPLQRGVIYYVSVAKTAKYEINGYFRIRADDTVETVDWQEARRTAGQTSAIRQ